ncbi:uncharacterized protein METZ01_LOCUS31134 [marine metagenome]|uniref:Hemolysin III family channel protein n=1 Tax=marine metagenome TaxID=408172 RepID=A0A381QH56_9ZZZZ
MKIQNKIRQHFYSEREEKINILSHGFGLILSIIGFVFLLLRALENGNSIYIFSLTVFGLSLILLYTASTLYHSTQEPVARNRYRMLDMAAIYVLIAGSYTPYALVMLKGTEGWKLFGIIWSIAFVGIIWKIFTTGKYNVISTLFYLFMGYLCLFYINPLLAKLPYEGLMWLISGGAAYTIGVFFYAMDGKIPYNHAIWHACVLFGSFSHFISIFFYVLPSS